MQHLFEKPYVLLFDQFEKLTSQESVLHFFFDNYTTSQLQGVVYLFVVLFIVALLTVLALSIFTIKRKREAAEAEEAVQRDFNNIPSGVLNVSMNGVISKVNLSAAKLLGRHPDTLVGHKLSQLFHDDDIKNVENAIVGEPSMVSARANASELQLALNFGQELREYNFQQRVVSLQDINELYQAHQSVEETNSKLNQLLDRTKTGRFVGDVLSKRLVFDLQARTMLFGNHQRADQEKGISFLDFEKSLHRGDINVWQRCLDRLQVNGEVTAHCRIARGYEANSENKGKYQLYYLSLAATNAKVEGRHNQFEAVIIPSEELAEHKYKLTTADNRLHSFVFSNPNPSYVIDENGMLVVHNDKFNALVRSLKSKVTNQDFFALELFPSDIMELHKPTNVVSSQAQQVNFKVMTKEGFEKQLRLTIAFYKKPEFLSDSVSRGAVVTIQDMTEQLSTKSALDRAKSELSDLVDLAPVAISKLDESGRIIAANRRMTKLLKYNENEITGVTLFDLLPISGHAETIKKMIKDTGQLKSFKTEIKGHDSCLHAIELYMELISRERGDYYCWIIDRTDEEFQKTKYDSVIHNGSFPMAILGNKGFTFLNDAAVEFFGQSDEASLLGKTPYLEEFNKDNFNSNELAITFDRLRTTGKNATHEWEFKFNEQLVPCEATYIPFFKHDEFDSILCLWIDKRGSMMQVPPDGELINHTAATQELNLMNLRMQNQIDMANDEIEALTSQLAENQSELVNVQQQVIASNDIIREKESEIGELKHTLASQKDSACEFQKEVESKQKNQRELQSKLAEQLKIKQKHIAKSEQIIHRLKIQTNNVTEQNLNSENELSELRALLEERELELSKYKKTSLELAIDNTKPKKKQKTLAQQIAENKPKYDIKRPEVEKIPMPLDPDHWFELEPFIVSAEEVESLPVALNDVMDSIEEHMLKTEKALDEENATAIFKSIRALLKIADDIASESLKDQLHEIENDCNLGMIENIHIRWPATRKSLEQTMRVVYSHVHE